MLRWCGMLPLRSALTVHMTQQPSSHILFPSRSKIEAQTRQVLAGKDINDIYEGEEPVVSLHFKVDLRRFRSHYVAHWQGHQRPVRGRGACGEFDCFRWMWM